MVAIAFSPFANLSGLKFVRAVGVDVVGVGDVDSKGKGMDILCDSVCMSSGGEDDGDSVCMTSGGDDGGDSVVGELMSLGVAVPIPVKPSLICCIETNNETNRIPKSNKSTRKFNPFIYTSMIIN
jgi:hypothetical protein